MDPSPNVANPRAEPGGVAFAGRAEHVYRANLWLRTASRVVARMGEFHATTFRDLEREARLLPWELFVGKGAPVRFRVTCRKSKLYHSDADYAIADRVTAIAADRGVKPTQIALAWLLAKPGLTAPIIGASKLPHLDDAIGAVDLRLSEAEIARLEEPYRPLGVLGHF